MPGSRKNISDAVRGITRKALTQGKLDRAAVRKVTGEAMAAVREAAAMNGPKAREDLAHARRNLGELERLFMRTLREAAAAGKGAASQSMSATLASGAMVARIASGMLAGIADSLADRPPRTPRRPR
jgi:hypothetical protein